MLNHGRECNLLNIACFLPLLIQIERGWFILQRDDIKGSSSQDSAHKQKCNQRPDIKAFVCLLLYSFASKLPYVYTSTFQSRFHLSFSISLSAADSLFLLFSKGMVKSSMPLAGHQRCLCVRGTLLTARHWKLVAVSALKFDCCREMEAILRRSSHSVDQLTLPLLYSPSLARLAFVTTWEPQSRGNIGWNLSLCSFPARSGYQRWYWFQ